MSRSRPPQNYIDNKEFYDAIVDWRNSGVEKIPDKIGEYFLLIAKNLARSGRFAGYSWREEMVSDAILVMVKYARNFDPEKSTNPFAFFTRCAWNCFIHRIGVEKKNLELMQVLREDAEELYGTDLEGDEDYGYIDSKAKQVNATFSKEKKYLKPKEKKKKEKSTPSIDKFLGD